MECYVRLLTMSRHTTGWQQTRHYRVQVSKLLLRYWVLVSVSAICALSDYGVQYGVSATIYMQGYSLLSLFDMCLLLLPLEDISVVHYIYIYATASSNNY